MEPSPNFLRQHHFIPYCSLYFHGKGTTTKNLKYISLEMSSKYKFTKPSSIIISASPFQGHPSLSHYAFFHEFPHRPVYSIVQIVQKSTFYNLETLLMLYSVPLSYTHRNITQCRRTISQYCGLQWRLFQENCSVLGRTNSQEPIAVLPVVYFIIEKFRVLKGNKSQGTRKFLQNSYCLPS
jgi:hypothetical protein